MKKRRPFVKDVARKVCGGCSNPDFCREALRCASSGRALRIWRRLRGGIQRKTPRGEPISKIVHVQ